MKKRVVWVWGPGQEQAFNLLRQALVEPPILVQADQTSPFTLRTDGSSYATGAVLLQGTGAEERPVEYASHLLIPAERYYSTSEREALAVVWAVEKFRP